jgi:hypothetical protein
MNDKDTTEHPESGAPSGAAEEPATPPPDDPLHRQQANDTGLGADIKEMAKRRLEAWEQSRNMHTPEQDSGEEPHSKDDG